MEWDKQQDAFDQGRRVGFEEGYKAQDALIRDLAGVQGFCVACGGPDAIHDVDCELLELIRIHRDLNNGEDVSEETSCG